MSRGGGRATVMVITVTPLHIIRIKGRHFPCRADAASTKADAIGVIDAIAIG